MRLACSTILYGGHPLDSALASIAGAGYAAIELGAIPSMADHLSADQPEQHYRDLRRRIEDAGLALESIGASTNLLDPTNRDRFVRLMHAGAILGAPAITSGSGGVSDDEASFGQVVENIRDLSRVAADTGVRLSIKPHVKNAVYNIATARRFMAEVDQRHVGLNYDASHIYRAGEDPVAAVTELGPFFATGRIRDMLGKQEGPGPVENQIPGKGSLDLPALLAAFARLPLPYLTLEIVGAKDLPIAEVDRVIRESYAYLTERLPQS